MAGDENAIVKQSDVGDVYEACANVVLIASATGTHSTSMLLQKLSKKIYEVKAWISVLQKRVPR